MSPVLVPIAHAGHWLVYVIPIAVVLIAVLVSALRERRGRAAARAGADEDVGHG